MRLIFFGDAESAITPVWVNTEPSQVSSAQASPLSADILMVVIHRGD